MTCSATTGRNVTKLLSEASGSRIGAPPGSRPRSSTGSWPTHGDTPPPARHGKRLRIYYAAQVGRRPPRFAAQVNDRRLIWREWAFHFENRLREPYGLWASRW